MATTPCRQLRITTSCARSRSKRSSSTSPSSSAAERAGRSIDDSALAETPADNVPYISYVVTDSTGAGALRLASYVPAVRTRLMMTGFPLDFDPTTARLGRMTTTEDCWTLSGSGPSAQFADSRMSDLSMKHNCTTDGGNSGGPMWLEGTRDVVGEPFTYIPDGGTSQLDPARRREDALAPRARARVQ